MIEMKLTGDNAVTLWDDGVQGGAAAWSFTELSWDRERAKVAQLSVFEAEDPDHRRFLLAYLEFLWEGQGVAALRYPDGAMHWYHKELERRYKGCAGE